MPGTLAVNVHMKSTQGLTVGEAAGRFGVATHVLRHWESMGLLSPARDAGGQRRYSPEDLTRVAMILMGKEAGLGLRELSEVLSTPDPMDHAELLRHHVTVLEQRIARAQTAKSLIEHALSCPLSFADCPHAREQLTAFRSPVAKSARC
jgi:DNA-binding transcriptional MerR regulator